VISKYVPSTSMPSRSRSRPRAAKRPRSQRRCPRAAAGLNFDPQRRQQTSKTSPSLRARAISSADRSHRSLHIAPLLPAPRAPCSRALLPRALLLAALLLPACSSRPVSRALLLAPATPRPAPAPCPSRSCSLSERRPAEREAGADGQWPIRDRSTAHEASLRPAHSPVHRTMAPFRIIFGGFRKEESAIPIGCYESSGLTPPPARGCRTGNRAGGAGSVWACLHPHATRSLHLRGSPGLRTTRVPAAYPLRSSGLPPSPITGLPRRAPLRSISVLVWCRCGQVCSSRALRK